MTKFISDPNHTAKETSTGYECSCGLKFTPKTVDNHTNKFIIDITPTPRLLEALRAPNGL